MRIIVYGFHNDIHSCRGEQGQRESAHTYEEEIKGVALFMERTLGRSWRNFH